LLKIRVSGAEKPMNFFKMIKSKKAIIMSQIVWAALALIVIIISVLIITGQLGAVNKTLNDCESKGGECILADECDSGPSFLPGCKDNTICCISP
jgi:hypothetical protein